MDAPASTAPLQGLGHLLEFLEQATATLADGREELDRRSTRAAELLGSLDEGARVAEHAFDAFDQQLTSLREAGSDGLEHWRAAAETAGERLATRHQAMEAAAERCTEGLAEARDGIETASDGVAQAVAAGEEALAALETAVDGCEERLSTALEATAHALAEAGSRAAESAEEVERHARDLADETATDLAQRAATALDASHGLFDRLGPRLQQAAADAAQATSGAFAELAGAGLEAHDRLQDEIAEAAAAVQDLVAGGALDLVDRAAEAAVEAAVEAAIQELTELASTLAAGQAVTAAAAPLFPQLAVARRIAEVINDLLEALPGL